MKKIVTSLSALVVAAFSMDGVNTYAEENTDTERVFKHPAFCQNAEGFNCGFSFGDNKFAVIKGIKPQNMETFKPDKNDFDEKNFGEMKEKIADLTEEEKVEIKEKLAEKNMSARKPKAFKKSNRRMMFGKCTSIEEEQ